MTKLKYDKILGKMRESDENTLHKGTFVDLAALIAAHPTAEAGASADVDAGAGSEVKRYIWDNDDNAWTPQDGASTQMTDGQVKTAYENNPDTNAFTDAEKAKLGSIGADPITLETSGNVTIDANAGDKFIIPTPTDAIVLGDANFSDMKEAIVDVNNGYGNISFPASWEWVGHEAPILTDNGLDRIKLSQTTRGVENTIIAERLFQTLNAIGNDSYTKLLIHADGDNDGTIFTDNSASAKTVTATNVVSKTGVRKFGTASALFSSGSLSVPFTDSLAGDFTIDLWIYPTNLTGSQIIFARCPSDTTVSGGFFLFMGNGQLTFSLGTQVNSGVYVNANTWTHIAMIKSGSNLMLAKNGEILYNQAQTLTATDSGNFKLGHNYNINYFDGYMDEMRISIGTARWTADFTPPIQPYG